MGKIDKRFIIQAEKVFLKLNTRVMLYNIQGESLMPANAAQIAVPSGLIEGIICEHDGKLFYLTNGYPQLILTVNSELPGARDVINMASVILDQIIKTSVMVHDESSFYRHILNDDMTLIELQELAADLRINLTRHFCVIIFQCKNIGMSSVSAILSDIIPQSESDILIDPDRHSLVLLKDMDGIDGMDELYQYTEAVYETIITELAQEPFISVGTPRNSLISLGDSYQEAKHAMEIGKVFKPNDHIYIFSKLILERLMYELPKEVTAYYHGLLFNRKTSRLLNEEILHTVEMFFQKDLNLSDTARQLYIHRNTLVYRLDKVYRQTGLDLRKFYDAVTFRVLMELKKTSTE